MASVRLWLNTLVTSTTHITMTDDEMLMAWTAGVDVLFDPVRHLQVGGELRMYRLDRPPRSPRDLPGTTLSVADQPTTRFGVGAFVRGSW